MIFQNIQITKQQTNWAGSATLRIQVEWNLKQEFPRWKCGKKLSLVKDGPIKFALVFGLSYVININGYLVAQILRGQMSP